MSEANPNIQPTTKTLGFAKLNPTYIQPAILYSISRRSFSACAVTSPSFVKLVAGMTEWESARE
ncbi:MAG: hypothetical protein LBE22_02505 [Azoarcus sp.]|jgi:hypothetical protein|nr:hypothetical protein [Azoarcus sp.]